MPPSNRSVFVVEDDESIQEALTELLTLEGYEVTEALNGREALAILDCLLHPPTVILLDLSMPVMDGPTFLTELRKIARFRETPVYIMSAGGVREIPEFHEPQRVLPKPVDINRLLDLVAAHAG